MTATTPPPGTVLLAGGTGDLGGRILRQLLAMGATVRVLIRPETNTAQISQLRAQGVEVIQTSYDDPGGLRRACADVACVVSAINGLDSAIIGAQSRLLEAAAAAGVPRSSLPISQLITVVSDPEATGTCSSAETSRRAWTLPKSGPRQSSMAPSPTCSPGRHP